jgi:SAM-dependent methyltransferase
MIFELLKLNIDISDEEFNLIYPDPIRALAKKHWTSVAVATVSSEFLVDRPGTRVLDIGSGAGKFCLVGASNTQGHFTGVEQRSDLVDISNNLADEYAIENAKFVHNNITEIDFKNYDAFYFYNSFYENIDTENSIDKTIRLDEDLYHEYSIYLAAQFSDLPIGTRIVTNCSPLTITPTCYKLQFSMRGGLLRFWEKVEDNRNYIFSSDRNRKRRTRL